MKEIAQLFYLFVGFWAILAGLLLFEQWLSAATFLAGTLGSLAFQTLQTKMQRPKGGDAHE